jgi:hypothetical protein
MRASKLLLLLSLIACASSPARRAPEPGELRVSGAWMLVETSTSSIQGEFIAGSETCLFIKDDAGRYISFPWGLVTKAFVYRYDPKKYIIRSSVAMSLGFLSTPFINGFAFIFTGPAWLIAGTFTITTEVLQSRIRYRKSVKKFLDKALPYARFPQGMPLSIYQKMDLNPDCPPPATPETQPSATSAPSTAPTSIPGSLPTP